MTGEIREAMSRASLLAAVVGWPLDHSLSPAMHNAAYRELGLDWCYVRVPAPDAEAFARVAASVRRLPFVGFNVTMPYKQAMVGLSDEVADLARLAGAVNTVDCSDGRLTGRNTDGPGVLEMLETDMGFTPKGRAIALLGAGGAAGGALAALVQAGATSVAVVNRSTKRAETLVGRVRDRFPHAELQVLSLDERARSAVRGADLVLNATSVGMDPSDPAPIPASWLRSGQVVADMVYRARPTSFVEAARAVGADACDGLGMLVCQGAIAIDGWLGDSKVRAPRDVMRAAAKLELERRSQE